jgi:four helix bundle protein
LETLLNFHNLDVYKCALDHLKAVQSLLRSIGKGESDLKDQLKRAAVSIPLNIAEGSGKVTLADRSRFFAIDRGSAMECAAIFDCVDILRPELNGELLFAKNLAGRLVAILSKMARAT